MSLRYFISLAILLLPGLVVAQVYDRPLDIVYALQGGTGLSYSDEELLNYFDQVQPPITAMIPFFLNVADPSKYDSIVQSLQQRNITLIPAVGGPPSDGDLDIQSNLNIATGYKNYSDYIRLENLQGFYDTYGSGGIQNMITHCVSVGFKHIMLNPWPEETGGAAVAFANPEVDATYNQVLLDQNKQSNTVIPSATNWYPANQNKIKAIRSYRPSVSVLINYESPPQQDVLTNLEKANKGASTAAMQVTINEINGQYASEDLHWIPPLDQSYDAIALGTWDWIAEQLSKM